MGNALATRSERQTLWEAGILTNKMMLAAVFFTFVLQMAVVYLPFLQRIFKTEALSVLEMAISVGASLLVLIIIDAVKVIRRKVKKEK
jgi:Ca2+-transporting ATPase